MSTNTTVRLTLPADIASLLAGEHDLSQVALESLAVNGYREGKLSAGQVRRLLGYRSRMEVHAFLKEHGVFLHYGAEDLAHENSSSEARSTAEQTAFRTMLDHWAQTPSANQELRESTFSRELIYGDHN